MKNYLNFENDIKDIELEIEKLQDPYNNEGISTVDTGKIDKLQSDLDKKLRDVYSNLDPWQTTLVARHEDRPKSKFFIDNLFNGMVSSYYIRYINEFELDEGFKMMLIKQCLTIEGNAWG